MADAEKKLEAKSRENVDLKSKAFKTDARIQALEEEFKAQGLELERA